MVDTYTGNAGETWCVRTVSTDPEPVSEEEAGPECQRCPSTVRRPLLRQETIALDNLADLGISAPVAAELLKEAEISHPEVYGSGEWAASRKKRQRTSSRRPARKRE